MFFYKNVFSGKKTWSTKSLWDCVKSIKNMNLNKFYNFYNAMKLMKSSWDVHGWDGHWLGMMQPYIFEKSIN